MKSSTRSLLVATSLIVGACIPFPHRSFHTPLIHGTVSADGAPLAGAKVRAVAEPLENSCAGRHVEARTDRDGRFVLCPLPDFQLFLTTAAHRTFRWNVCVEHLGEWKLVHSDRLYTLVDSGPRVISRLECDLSATGEPCEGENESDVGPERLRQALGEKRCKGVSVERRRDS